VAVEAVGSVRRVGLLGDQGEEGVVSVVVESVAVEPGAIPCVEGTLDRCAGEAPGGIRHGVRPASTITSPREHGDEVLVGEPPLGNREWARPLSNESPRSVRFDEPRVVVHGTRERVVVAVCRSLQKAGMCEGGGGTATCCRGSLGRYRDMGYSWGCQVVPESGVEEGEGEYCREMSWSGERLEWEEGRDCINPPVSSGR
jgi:hypothetical protein